MGCVLVARINIEEVWWTDPRRFALAEKLGSTQWADGLVIEAWKMSQQFWGNGKKKIPYFVFKQIKNHELLFEFDLAIKRGETIYIRGTRQYHDWYAERIGASSKGGKSKAKEIKQTPSKQGSKRQANGVASSSSSFSSSFSKEKEEEYTSTGVDPSPSDEIIKIWNANRKTLPEVKNLNAKRRKLLALAWKENPSAEYWTTLVSSLASSDFYTGKNDRAWIATIDFILQPGKHIELTERLAAKQPKIKMITKEDFQNGSR